MKSMNRHHQYFVYITTNRSGTLYVGLTNNIIRRVHQHKNKLIKGFTEKYNIDKLVYYETFTDIASAITREKTIKGWLRRKKIELIETVNPKWTDLSNDWYE
jgi:putative endonuclease